MKALTFTIELLEPLLIANPVSGDENSAAGMDYIPGSVVRGALAQAFTQGKRGYLTDDRFRRLFFGDARFLNAYPEDRLGNRMLPTPRSWQRDKDARDGDPIIDLANSDAPKDRPLKGLGQLFAYIQPPPLSLAEDDRDGEDELDRWPEVEMYSPERDVSVHIAQRDRLSAVRTGTGEIYRYDALAAGQRFIGAILCNNDDVCKQLADLLSQTAFKLGKSRSAGYGAVMVKNVRDHDDWREYVPMSPSGTNHVVVTLLSDVILCDAVTGAYAESLAAWLGVEPQKSFARCHVVGGFNLAWGLPLPQAYAIQAGSVFVFKRTDALLEKLRQAELHGVGDRLADGFGRIAVDWHTCSELIESRPEQPSQPVVTRLTKGSPEHALAQQMVDRIWRAQLDQALRVAIGQSKIEHPPTNAQLSRMRLLVREAWRTGKPRLITDVIEEGKHPKAMKQHARDQFQRARISIAGTSKRLIEWLKELAVKPDQVWNTLPVNDLKRPEIGGVKAKDPPSLEYMARLIDGVLRKAAKEGSA